MEAIFLKLLKAVLEAYVDWRREHDARDNPSRTA